MAHRRRFGRTIPLLVLLALSGPTGAAPSDPPAVRLDAAPGSPHFGTVEAANLDSRFLADLAGRELTDGEWQAIFAVYTGAAPPAAGEGKPPVAGSWTVEDGVLRFRPRFPLVAGLAYSARLQLEGRPPIVASFALPAPETAPATRVVQVYPSGDEVPENLLRCYVHFSAPMSRGEAYEHLRLVDEETGAEVAAPFVEIGEELWDPEVRRLTLFFDPGRIKRGLVPHEQVGPPLAAGRSYRLIVDAEWPDARGVPLAAGFVKRFAVTAADRLSPDPADWRVVAPPAASREPVELLFPEPLDHALLRRVVRVRDGAGNPVDGEVEVSGGERRWAFTPAEPWRAGSYAVEVATILEDPAGNSLVSVFDTDLETTPGEKIRDEEITLDFVVAAD